MSGLDPVVERAMGAAFSVSNPSGLHISDERLWMTLFPALIARGYTWHMDDIYEWLSRWPGIRGDRGMDNSNARKVYAWAQMALHQSDPENRSDSADYIIQNSEDELAG